MNKFLLKATISLFILLWVFSLNRVYAASSYDEYHSSTRMNYPAHGPVAKTYGYLHVISDSAGNGLIDVMFSNGDPAIQALFNASVRLLDSSGQVLNETQFHCRLGDLSADTRNECKVSKSISRTQFDSIEVDFYLSDIPNLSQIASR
jgi:hypothetical protein